MSIKRSRIYCVTLFLACCCLFLFGCREATTESESESIEAQTLYPLNIEYERFQKVVGWLSDDTVLVHTGDSHNHQIKSHNINNGEAHVIYEESNYFLTIFIHSSKDKIIIQEVNNNESRLNLIDTDGNTLQSVLLDHSGYVSLDWNETDERFVFISHYSYDVEEEVESTRVLVWDLEENNVSNTPINSLSPKWYSSNLYLYVDEENLYIGDRREEDEDDLLIDTQTSEFFIHQDTFIGFVESDIQSDELYLFHEYPFLTDSQILSIPKVTMNDRPVEPHLTQSNRNGKIIGSIPTDSFVLEDEIGEYTLAELDFDENTIQSILTLPQDAPINLSPNEELLLYGWRFEYIINLNESEIIPLLNELI